MQCCFMAKPLPHLRQLHIPCCLNVRSCRVFPAVKLSIACFTFKSHSSSVMTQCMVTVMLFQRDILVTPFAVVISKMIYHRVVLAFSWCETLVTCLTFISHFKCEHCFLTRKLLSHVSRLQFTSQLGLFKMWSL